MREVQAIKLHVLIVYNFSYCSILAALHHSDCHRESDDQDKTYDDEQTLEHKSHTL